MHYTLYDKNIKQTVKIWQATHILWVLIQASFYKIFELFCVISCELGRIIFRN